MSTSNRVGRYEILERLGQGGMGVVYLASDPLLQRTVAIKVLSTGGDETDQAELRERFAREARSVASLRHHHIVTIYDVGEDQGRPFIAMEFLDGETMAEMIRRRAAVSVKRKLQLAKELCSGLGYAHRSGIIHRDIKPANLMITAEGGIKILDFGLARLSAHVANAALTRAGTLMGTPSYMSPEQVTGKPLDQRADIFSVGVVIFELLTYQKAFAGDSPHVVLHNILYTDPPALTELMPGLDPALDRIVARAVAREREARYENLGLLAADLGAVIDRTPSDDMPSAPVGPPPGVPRGSGSVSPRGNLIQNLDALHQRRADQIEVHLSKARSRLAAGEHQPAVEACEAVLLLDPQNPDAMQILEAAHRALEDRQVQGWLDEAHSKLSQGALTDAELLVAESLRLRPELRVAQQLQHAVHERRLEAERAAERARAVNGAIDRARDSLAAGAADAALRSASEALAYDPANEEARAIRQQALDAIEVQRVRQAHEQLAAAAVAEARVEATSGNFDRALDRLRRVAPPHPAVTAMIDDVVAEQAAWQRRRDDEAKRQREVEEARRREEEARRLRELEEAQRRDQEARRQRDLEDARRREEEARIGREREQERQRVKREEATRQTPPAADTVPTREPPVHVDAAALPLEARPWHRKPAVMGSIGAAAVVIAAIALWLAPGDDPVTRPPDQLAGIVSQAQNLYRAGNGTGAIDTAVKGLQLQPDDPRLAELLERIRNEAAAATDAARQQAVAAGADRAADFQAAEQRRTEAAALVAPLDTARAVTEYREAAALYDNARTSLLSVQEIIQLGRQAWKGQKIDQAIVHAEQALAKDGANRDALQLLSDIRRAERGRAQTAKTTALRAGAASYKEFGEGDLKLTQAAALPDRETRRQIALLSEAIAAFDAARAAKKTADDAAATGAAATARAAMGRAQASFDGGRLDDAKRQIDESLALADSADARRLKADIDAAIDKRNRDETARVERRRRIEGLIDQAKKQPDTAVQVLGQARATADEFPDLLAIIDSELKARSGGGGGRGGNTGRNAGGGGTGKSALEIDLEAIDATLDAYADAYRQLNVERLIAVAPFMAPRRAALTNAFAAYESYGLTLSTQGTPEVRPDGTARVSATLVHSPKIRNGVASTDKATADFTLARVGDRWEIRNITFRK